MADFLDDRGHLFGKVNVVDLVVLLLILALVGFAYARFSGGGTAEEPYRLVVSVERVRQATVDELEAAVEVGEDVYTETGAYLGKVKDRTVSPVPLDATVLPASPTGEVEGATVDSGVFFDVILTIEGEAVRSSNGYSIGGTPLRTGKVLTLVGGGFEVRSTVLSARSTTGE